MIYLFWFLQAVLEESLSNAPSPLGKKIHAGKKKKTKQTPKINTTKEDTDLSVLTETVIWSSNKYMKRINWFPCPDHSRTHDPP